MTAKIWLDGKVTVELTPAQVLQLEEHKRLCVYCRTLCPCCRRYLCCAGAERLVEHLVKKGGCAS